MTSQFVAELHAALPPDLTEGDGDHAVRWRRLNAAAPTEGDWPIVESWMWDCLGGDTVPAWVPEAASDLWETMLQHRTPAVADAARRSLWGYLRSLRCQATYAAVAANAAGQSVVQASPAVAARAVRSAASAAARHAGLGEREHPGFGDFSQYAIEFWRAANPATLLDTIQKQPPGAT